MISSRRFPRYPVNLRLRLQFPRGEIETTTDEISLAGFSAPCPELPEVGTAFGFVVHLPDGTQVTGSDDLVPAADVSAIPNTSTALIVGQSGGVLE